MFLIFGTVHNPVVNILSNKPLPLWIFFFLKMYRVKFTEHEGVTFFFLKRCVLLIFKIKKIYHFGRPHPWHVEMPGPGIEPVSQR